MRAPDGYFYIYAPHPRGLYARVVDDFPSKAARYPQATPRRREAGSKARILSETVQNRSDEA
jgi:hypothetical protein